MLQRTGASLVLGAMLVFATLGYLATSNCSLAPAAPKDDVHLAEVREIDLSVIYSTSSQRGFVDVQKGLKEGTPEWKEPYNIGSALDDAKSAPFAAVVRGDDVREAVLATSRVIKLKELPARPVGPDDQSSSKKCWLFVYIGHDSSSPPQWLIYPPTIFGNKVRFTYTHFDGWFSPEPDEGRSASADDHSYLYWAPLGESADPTVLRAELVELTKTVRASYPAKKKK